MRPSGPPVLATWLMTKLLTGDKRESMIGDLIEQHQRGRSSAWYWRQAIGTIATSAGSEMWAHKTMAVLVLLFSAYFDRLYMVSRVWMLVWRVDRLWYPRLIGSRWSWLAVNPWAYRLQPYWWTANLAWCLLLAAMTWFLTRVYPRQRGLVIALVLIGQLAARAPFMWTGVTDVFREPADPIRFYGVLWFAFYTLVAIPLSVALGGRVRSSEF